MILDCILTSVNENKLYLDFVPIFIKTWKKLYPLIDVKIILISKEIPINLLVYQSNIILFEPINNVLTSFSSQFIRLLYPSILNYKNGIMITDIDMLPMNKTYFTDNIKNIANDKFIYFRGNQCFQYKQIAMCYNVALPTVWKDIFEIYSVEDIIKAIKEIFNNYKIVEGHNKEGWNIDQLILYKKVMNWNKKKESFICLNENITGFNRLSRGRNINNNEIKEKISKGVYSDYHCLRPMKTYYKINYEFFNLL